MGVVKNWWRRHFSDPQVVILALLLVGIFAVILWFGDILAPALASVVIAYLLNSLVDRLHEWGIPRLAAVYLVFLVFLALTVFLFLGLIPLLSGQVAQFIQELPGMIARIQQVLLQLPERYPGFISEEQINEVITVLRTELAQSGQALLTFSLKSIASAITLLVYMVLVPLMVFFFLKDKDRILCWLRGFLPRNTDLVTRVWREVDQQLGNYVRGKVIEIIIVGLVSFFTFALMGLNYAMLLGALVGLSVVVPYIGAVVVTIPVALIAFFQWGWGPDFIYLMIAYAVIQALDGNVLVPLLFSEAVNLHPVAIILAILFFGGLWGFWGVFFAIPLAALVKAVIDAWPRLETSPESCQG